MPVSCIQLRRSRGRNHHGLTDALQFRHGDAVVNAVPRQPLLGQSPRLRRDIVQPHRLEHRHVQLFDTPSRRSSIAAAADDEILHRHHGAEPLADLVCRCTSSASLLGLPQPASTVKQSKPARFKRTADRLRSTPTSACWSSSIATTRRSPATRKVCGLPPFTAIVKAHRQRVFDRLAPPQSRRDPARTNQRQQRDQIRLAAILPIRARTDPRRKLRM